MNRTSLLYWGKLMRRIFKFLRDKDVSLFKKSLFLIPLIYTLSPIDLVSDFIPVIGWLDDITILTIAWNFFLQELTDYETEQNSNSDDDKELTLDHTDYQID
ncbi:MAG: YkvA family protein [Bacillota bacterium]